MTGVFSAEGQPRLSGRGPLLEHLFDQLRDVVGHGRRGSEARRLHAHKVNRLRYLAVAGDDKIDDAGFMAWRNELWTEAGVAQLQIALFHFRQKGFGALRKSGDGQAVLRVAVFALYLGCRRAKKKRAPQRFGEMHAET